MVHGAVDRAAGMIRVARSIAEYPVLRYDRRGYGRSSASNYPISFEQHVEDLERVIDGVPSIIFGHSYGGSIALSAASRGRQPIRAVVSYEARGGGKNGGPRPPQRLLIQVMLQSILFVVWLARNGGGCFPRKAVSVYGHKAC